MSKLRAVRRPLIVSFVVCCLGAFTLLAVTQALAARRPFGSRLRPAARAPSSSTPAATPPSIQHGTPTPALDPRRPEPDPPTAGPAMLRDGLVRVAGHQDEEAVMQEIIEIRRRLRRDPSFRGIADATPHVERYETSEPAFKRILEEIGSGERSVAICKTKTDGDCETNYWLTIQADQCPASECCAHKPCANPLRAAARVLDSRANDCEDAKSFTRADELREMARQLRQEARHEDGAKNE